MQAKVQEQLSPLICDNRASSDSRQLLRSRESCCSRKRKAHAKGVSVSASAR